MIPKECSSENASLKQNGARPKNTFIKILMDSGASALMRKWSTMASSFSRLHEAEIELKTPELYVTAHVSAQFYVIT